MGWGYPTSLPTAVKKYKANQRKPPAPPRGTSRGVNIYEQAIDRTSMNPASPSHPQLGWINQAGIPGALSRYAGGDPTGLVRGSQDYYNAVQSGALGNTQPVFPMPPGGSNRGGGGGGGGGGGAAGLDQATFDWMMAQLKNRPANINYRELDLPDPSQYMRWDPSQYATARQGVTSGLAGVQQRANTAYDAAQTELGQYRNPYEGGLRTQNPMLSQAMERMASQNAAGGAFQAANAGMQSADQGLANTLAMLAANDQARQAANYRALAGDRRTTEQNLGLEGNMLNLGVNMAEARGKTAFDQRLQDAMYQAAQNETMQNYARQNEVEATNVGTQNKWMQDTLAQILQLVGAKGAGTALPGDMSWLSVLAPGINLQGGSGPIPGAPA